MNLPKLSYVLLSHNREKYIRGAIESAFAQDYEGELEYIFSDDCSTDRTYEIIQECVRNYKGNRKVIVTQTPKNLHLAGNTNHAVQFATGDFVVRADDDDYSTVDRCSIIGKAIAQNPGCSSVITKLKHFTDEEDSHIRELCQHAHSEHPDYQIYDIFKGYDGLSDFYKKDSLHQAWSIDVYKKFSPLPLDGYWVDDVMCMYRANVLGFCISIPLITAMVRQASLNMSTGGNDGTRGYKSIIRLEKFNDKYMDITYPPLQSTITEITQYIQQNRAASYSSASNFFNTLEADMQKRKLLQSYWKKGIRNRFRIRKILNYKGLFSILRCLPMPLFAFLLTCYRVLFRKM